MQRIDRTQKKTLCRPLAWWETISIQIRVVIIGAILSGIIIPLILKCIFPPRSNLKLVDIFMEENYIEPCDPYIVLDIKVKNDGEKTAFLKRARFYVMKVWELKPEALILRAPTLPSAEYDIELSPLGVPYTQDKAISHSIKTNDVDRIVFKIKGPGLFKNGCYIYHIKVSLVYDEKDKTIDGPELLFCQGIGCAMSLLNVPIPNKLKECMPDWLVETLKDARMRGGAISVTKDKVARTIIFIEDSIRKENIEYNKKVLIEIIKAASKSIKTEMINHIINAVPLLE